MTGQPLEIIAFTRNGAALAEKIQQMLPHGRIYAPERLCHGNLRPYGGSVAQWTGERFRQGAALVFIGAAGIAVRAVAPCIEDKAHDPAVLCVDECGQHVIPLLSGHLGGANRLAIRLAELLGAEAVLTTATDINGVFSPDAWAAEHNCAIPETREIKHISSALLEGRSVGFFSDFPVDGPLPEGVGPQENCECGIAITLRDVRPFRHTLRLVPRCIVAGIGCRRGVSFDILLARLREELALAGIPLCAVGRLASIDLKAAEPGLLRLAEYLRADFTTCSAEELMAQQGDFTASSMVMEVTGSDNVCERAVSASGGRLLTQKSGRDGVTLAIGQMEWRASFA